MNVRDVRDCFVRPALQDLGLWSLGAEQLVLGTAAHESGAFEYVQQVRGPALSLWQIEPVTYLDLVTRTLPKLLRTQPQAVATYTGMMPRRYAAYAPAEHLARDQYFAAATCRLLYYRAPEACPDDGDVEAMAALWKLRYNTPLGAGKPAQWLNAWSRDCAQLYP